MTTAHTPAPWTVRDGHEHSEDCPLNVWATDGRIVAAVVGMGDYLLEPATEEGQANARLIAAAPDLLAALRDLLAGMEQHGAEKWMPHRMDRARAAITKAGG